MASLISLVVPVYRNADNLPALLEALRGLRDRLAADGHRLEVVFVVDGSPDASALLLRRDLPGAGFSARLLELSRNFGSFAAIRAGLAAGSGDHFAVMAADLQEPPELIAEFARRLASGRVDVVVGRREGREDGFLDAAAAGIFWGLYRRCVNSEVPAGGIDVFGCSRAVRDQLLALGESHSSLVALLLWVGFRRDQVPYRRRRRQTGRSAWTFGRKVRYVLDSVYSFSDLPIRWLLYAGVAGLLLAASLSLLALGVQLGGWVELPENSAALLLFLFFAGLNAFGLGVIGSYVWRTYENTKNRPSYIVARQESFEHE